MKSTQTQGTVKTTKQTATARGHNHRNRGRQGQRHTMSIAGGIRTDCRDHKSAQMTESWNSEEEDSKSNQSHATQVSKEQPLMGVTCKGHAGVRETDQMIAMNTGGMSHSKT